MLKLIPTWQIFTNRSRQRLIKYVITLVVGVFIFNGYQHTFSQPGGPRHIQHDFERGSFRFHEQPERLRAVRDEFMHAWTGYKRYSWLGDSLMSLSGGRKDQFCGWAATLIDSLDTLYIMGLEDEFEEAVSAMTTINFEESTARCQVNVFESTIRYLGGMLAAFDLSRDQRFLPKLVELGDILHSAFNSTNGMPCINCLLGRQKEDALIVPARDVPLADMGSFYLEFARLWQITGDNKYLDTVQLLTSTFEKAQNESSIPGLWPERLDASSIDGPEAAFVSNSNTYSLGALSDSAYEYLVKGHLLLGGLTDQYMNMWKSASSQIKQLLLFRAYIPQWKDSNILFSGIATMLPNGSDVMLQPRTQHLACFAGGMFAMSSRIFDEPEDLEIGEALTNGCVWAYDNSPIGIMPETFSLLGCPDLDDRQCAWNATLWEESRHNPKYCDGSCKRYRAYPPGYLSSIDEHYGLRPEAIESVFIMYRITGNPKWREDGWRMFTKIIEHTRTPYGHASLKNVMKLRDDMVMQNGRYVVKKVAAQRDEMESFWLAETLKYFYLLFSDPDLISLDDFVLNTEAHPLRLTRGIRGFP